MLHETQSPHGQGVSFEQPSKATITWLRTYLSEGSTFVEDELATTEKEDAT
jgi:hypothetical protein